jgi:alpha-galactosidase
LTLSFYEKNYKDCYCIHQNGHLRIGNSVIERTWQLTAEDVPVCVSVSDKVRNQEWIDPSVRKFPIASLPGSILSTHMDSSIDTDHGISAPHLKVELHMKHTTSETKLVIRVYPDTPIIRTSLLFRPATRGEGTDPFFPDGQSAAAVGMELQLDDNNKQRANLPGDYVDCLQLSPLHCSWKAIAFRDVTDTNNNLVNEMDGLLYPKEKRSVEGNLLLITDRLNRSGLCLIKEGPTPIGHLHYPGGDFQFHGKTVFVTGSGFPKNKRQHDTADVSEESEHPVWMEAYGAAIGVCAGEERDKLALLSRYFECLRITKPERDLFVMSNTWGDRSRDGRVNESFILAELEAAASLGITHVQIDDGWQKGTTSNSVNASNAGGRWSGYYDGVDGFWVVHPERFPNGLRPIADAARERGVKLGLWFSPDSDNHFANWSKDADTLLKFWSDFGIASFKLDGIHVKSKQGETNLLAMMTSVIDRSGGDVYFNLDTTSQIRQGYFCRTQYGGLFLENRYTDWGNYYPYWTLRNLWKLAKYVPAQKLQIEFLNVYRNTGSYGDDPLSPASCGIAYAFAVSMIANPLAWMELTGLDEGSADVLQKLLSAYGSIRKELLAGRVLPIGEEPSGTGWTGLQSVLGRNSGYALVFRELTDQSEYAFRLWDTGASQALKLTRLVGSTGRDAVETEPLEQLAGTDSSGYVRFSLPAPLTFALYRYEAVSEMAADTSV